MEKGTILVPTGSADHLHFICCDPVFYPNLGRECILAVNISTINDGTEYDRSCILSEGDHRFIKHPSYIYYRKADIFDSDSISRNVAEGNFRVHDPCNDQTFAKVMKGFESSEEVRYKIKRFYESYCS